MFEIKKELLDSHEALLEVVFDDTATENAKRRVARAISRRVNIPGFRKGHAPYGKIVQYVGEATILQEAAEMLLDETYSQIIEKAEITPYGPGEFVDMDPTPLTFKLRVPLMPTVELGDYRSLREEWEDPTVSEEEIQQVLEQVREEHVILEPVDRPAEQGDQVMVNVKATVDDDIIVDEDDIEVVLSQERPFLSLEFVDALLGASVGEERTFPLTLPETIDEPSLRGVTAQFTVKVTQVYARKLPELDDALASAVGAFETLEELRQDIHDRILVSKKEEAEIAYRNKLSERLAEQADIKYPPQMVEEMLDDLIERAEERVKQERQMSLEDVLTLAGQTRDQYRESLRPEAEHRIKLSLALSKFAEEEGIDVNEDEIVQEYGDFLSSLNIPTDAALRQKKINIDSQLGRHLRMNILGRKVSNRLAAIGKGELEKLSVQDSEPPTEEDEIVEPTDQVPEESTANQSVTPESEDTDKAESEEAHSEEAPAQEETEA